MAFSKGEDTVTTTSVTSSPPNGVHRDDMSIKNDAELKRRVMRKIDYWLVGFYSLVYIFRVIDSQNYANAAIINLEAGTGIKKELNFNASQWAWTQSIFSYSYLIFEPSNTVLLKWIKPSRCMFVLILSWGVCACAAGAAQDFPGMMCVRFAIGLAEAGFYPAVLYHMAFWYKPSELRWRIALFYSLGQVSGALSGLLAYAISYMDGAGGISGWRWLFILEGLPAIVLSVVALFGLPDYPENARMLTEEERIFLNGRLSSSAPSGKDKSWDWAGIKALFSSPTLYTFSVYWIGHGIGGFGVNYALPTVIYELGFTSTALSQLMNIPPYVACFFFLNTLGYLLHKGWIRPWTSAVAIESTIIICYIILITVSNSIVKYIALIVATACAGSAYPVIWPERIRALDGTVAAGIGIGLTNAMAQFSGIAGPHIYSSVFGPTYHVSYIICLSFLCLAISGILSSWWLVWRKDKENLKTDAAARNGLENEV
ncbi:Major facilitator superfamily domain general substrate transporter [Penicillium cosmopolitanum]|uniref:Major facilitator superfamily domain general substrate transporter n=1 Tax=Penicillium cosmopolitanum TaxID=1131564 RepID=A0A9W9VRW1_9EURO|nr:Major facilitator superfamily domain general substrate transporter [Penicillium cosmopolitanum]KAJ5388153.1 Major facilitator superfamily domain general substrate transporter [Penicillium cosmopolitanum]